MGVREIALASRRRCRNTGKYVTLVDDCDFEYLNQYAWSPLVIAGTNHPLVYAYGGGHPQVLMHRVIWERAFGTIPVGLELDHKEHGQFGGLDNRRENLRLATRSDQNRNTRKQSGTVSKFRGVYWHKKASKWAVEIHVHDYPVYLGLFESEEQAALAYDSAARDKFGKFAQLNFPERAA
jgi:hypothetical protein